MTARELADEMEEREISLETFLEAGMLMIESDPNGLAKLMGLVGKQSGGLPFPAFPGFGR